ncbi:GNAT family N-acetyltransferase [Desulforamulus aeronauticus]|uniref:Protein N-acetyltransferase, RimJ/RimL family n=1 Tax=Desulforamulus aeronauticus DSM 10349 TaxID=1121421 RepID=A0A1M6W648_9FIRM|nr:GNAT family N-acetyltransferase [Desulforamulus aeronauticus]SHK88945.1 Protein N-acetyltransferase, RimJ/RimL family [Desulforamulus aeronauticus DSM 10349]
MQWILQSERLAFRKIDRDDFKDLCTMLQDIEVMYAWEHAFTDEEVYEWIDKNLIRYENEGFSYFAAIEKATGKFVGVIGPLIEEIDGIPYTGIAYILNKNFWCKGYAVEGAKACMDYAFAKLNADKVIAQIRPNNFPSRKVAEKLGMKIESEYTKHYNGSDMLHLIYSRTK